MLPVDNPNSKRTVLRIPNQRACADQPVLES
jgi:hypothetical protein